MILQHFYKMGTRLGRIAGKMESVGAGAQSFVVLSCRLQGCVRRRRGRHGLYRAARPPSFFGMGAGARRANGHELGWEQMKFLVSICRDEDGAYISECPSIPGCVRQGQTEAEAASNISDAIRECLCGTGGNVDTYPVALR